MPQNNRLRTAITWAALGIGIAFAAWAALLWLAGGLDVPVLGYRLRTHDPFKPLLAAAIAISIYILAGGRAPGWLRALGRALHGLPGRCEALDRVRSHSRRATLIGGSLVIALAALLAFQRPRIMPVHDTLQVFDAFYFFYSHLLTNGEAPHWVPYGAFGVPFGSWSILAVSPLGYLAAGAGWAAHWKDALAVFTLSVVFEQIVFAFGMAALLRRLALRPLIVWVTIGALLLSISWSTQIWWNFRIVYGLPLVLFFLVRFVQGGRVSDLCLSGLAEGATLVGNLSYFAPLHVLVVTVAGVVLVVTHRRTFRLVRPRRGWAVALLAAWTIASLGGWLLATRQVMQPLVPPLGHLPGDMSVQMDIYLTWAVNGSLGDTVKMIARGWPLFVQAYPDNTVYLGAFTLFFLMWGVVYNRHQLGFRLLAGLGLFVLWLSFAGVLALVLYHAPGFSIFRHLGLLVSMAAVFGFAAAAWGIEHFVRHAQARHVWWLLVVLWCLADAVSDPGQTLLYYRWWQGAGLAAPEAHQLARLAVGSSVLLFVLGLLSGGRRLPWRERVGGLSWLIVAAWLVDLALFGQFRVAHLPRLAPTDAAASQPVLDVRRPGFVERVNGADPISRQAGVLVGDGWKTIEPLKTTSYASTDMWTFSDGCRHIGLETFVLETTHQAFVTSETNSSALLSAVFRCEAPKVRLLPAQALDEGNRTTLPAPVGDVTIDTFSANAVSFTTHSDVPSVLFYADATFPDWRAFVDGRPEALVPAFGAFKSVPVAAGTHRVDFRFVPAWGLTAVEWLTLSAAVFLLALFGAAIRNTWRPGL